MTLEVSEEYQDLMQTSEKMHKYVIHQWNEDEEEELQINDSEILLYGCDLLSLNYRVGLKECGALRILNTETLGTVMLCGCGLKDVLKNVESKKN